MRGELTNLDATEQPNLSAARRCLRLNSSMRHHSIEKVNTRPNAVITPLFDKARTQAREEGDSSLSDGPFRGVPFLLKDLVCATGGDPLYAGMRLLRDACFVAPCVYDVDGGVQKSI